MKKKIFAQRRSIAKRTQHANKHMQKIAASFAVRGSKICAFLLRHLKSGLQVVHAEPASMEKVELDRSF